MEEYPNSSQPTLEYKLFKRTLFFITIALIILFVNDFFFTKIYISCVIEVIALVVVITFYMLLRQGIRVARLSPTLIALLIILADAGTITGSGLLVGNVVIYLLIVIIMNSLIPLKLKNLFGAIAFLNLVALAVIEYHWKLMREIKDPDIYMLNKDVFVFLGFGICFYLTAHLRTRFEEERALNVMQNAQLLEKNIEIESRNEEQKNLMAILAHDLNAPLHKIMGLTEMIKKTVGEAKRQKELIDMVSSVANSGRDLISEIVSLSNFEDGDYKLKMETFNLDTFIREMLKAYEGQAIGKRLLIEIDSEHESGDVLSDKHLLERVLDNLVSNAIKFSPENKRVMVKANIDRNGFCISIKDEGPGFTENDRTKLFRKFQKLSAQPIGDYQSTGLGLAIVKRLSELLKGKIELISEGGGAEFILTFPTIEHTEKDS